MTETRNRAIAVCVCAVLMVFIALLLAIRWDRTNRAASQYAAEQAIAWAHYAKNIARGYKQVDPKSPSCRDLNVRQHQLEEEMMDLFPGIVAERNAYGYDLDWLSRRLQKESDVWMKPASILTAPEWAHAAVRKRRVRAVEPTGTCRLLNVQTRVVESNRYWCRYSWKMTASNPTLETAYVHIVIEFLDKDSRIVAERVVSDLLCIDAYEERITGTPNIPGWVLEKRGGQVQIAGYYVLSPSVAAKVDRVQAVLTEPDEG